MPTVSLLMNKHLISRAGFGPNLSQLNILEKEPIKNIWKSISSEKTFHKISTDAPLEDYDYKAIATLDATQKKELNKRNRQLVLELNQKFLDEMVNSENQLREKMAFFWQGHFAVRIQNAAFNEQLLNILREHALGSFKNLLLKVSKAPAMLQFLNNQQNKKGHPNENFAREVMELFTMGRGNYSEEDIKESARAFTGWGYEKSGEFIFKEIQHDGGTKAFLGQTGNFNGDDIINIILEQKITAKFITTKIYRFFVNETPDKDIIEHLSDSFYHSGYDIKRLMQDIFTSDWFYDVKNIGAKIKSPIELIAGIMRILPMDIGNKDSLILYQKLLGQRLFAPPNVAGWPMGKDWIDSSSLILRMQLPQIMSGIRPLDYMPQADDDLDMGIMGKQKINKLTKNAKINIDWNSIESTLSGKDLFEILLQHIGSLKSIKLNNYYTKSTRENIINIMSTPEYQLC
jgi:uncharacterized protein (DUF1800 family)